MAITITAGAQVSPGQYRSLKAYTQSTSTGVQILDAAFDVLTLGAGTATGFGVNRYLLATDGAREGRRVCVQTAATCEAHLVFSGTATGQIVFQADADTAELHQSGGVWFVEHTTGATVATATGTA